jgi:hypothetical protein
MSEFKECLRDFADGFNYMYKDLTGLLLSEEIQEFRDTDWKKEFDEILYRNKTDFCNGVEYFGMLFVTAFSISFDVIKELRKLLK